MSVSVISSDPNSLLQKIRADMQSGLHATWTIDADGDLTLSADSDHPRAWLRPRVLENKIVFNILGSKHRRLLTGTYASYHAGLVEMLLNFYDQDFESVKCSALGDIRDQLGGEST